jgi:hypothetical protein
MIFQVPYTHFVRVAKDGWEVVTASPSAAPALTKFRRENAISLPRSEFFCQGMLTADLYAIS